MTMSATLDKIAPWAETATVASAKQTLLMAKVTRHEVFLGRTMLWAKNKKKTLQKYIAQFAIDTKELTNNDPATLVQADLWAEAKKLVQD